MLNALWQVFILRSQLCVSYLCKKISNLRLYAKPARLTLRCSIKPRYFTWCRISASSNVPGVKKIKLKHVLFFKKKRVFLIKWITWMLGLIWFQAAYVPGLFSHEDLCQLQQAALELGRHLQTQDEGHNPQQFVCQAHVALQWLPLTGRKMTWPDPTHNPYMDWFSSPNALQRNSSFQVADKFNKFYFINCF